MHYYNEFDPFAADWLENLIFAGEIPQGVVDRRSITEVMPDDLAGFTQCHFFAGIGGWPLALRMAGWPEDREIWTGSPPCQPFSVSGKQKGKEDERHPWPELFRLIAARWPAVFMGEQVAAAVGLDWLDGVLADLEGSGYAGRSVVLPACSVDAPQRRDRLWIVADGYGAVTVAHGDRVGSSSGGAGSQPGESGQSGVIDHRCSADHAKTFWSDATWISGHDGKARRIKPGLRLLANGVLNRVGRLRAYGNAIVPEVAAEVIGAYMDVT